MREVQVPADKIDAFRGMWDWAAFTEAGNWQYQNVAFTKDQAGNAKTVSVLYTVDAAGKYTFLIADI